MSSDRGTRRKRAQEELQRSEERYRTFIQQSSEGIWRFELEQPVRPDDPEEEQIDAFYAHAYLAECNDALARMYGFSSASEIIGARLGDMLVRSDLRNVDYLRAFIRSGYRLSDAESREVDRDGNPKVFLNNLVGIIEDGRLVRAWGTQRDVTERKEIEQALSEERERLRVTLASIGDAVIATDHQGRVTFCNPVAEALTGWTQAEADGAPLETVFPIVNEYSRRPAENPVTQALREGTVVGLANHTLLLARDGTERPIDDSAAPIRGENGELIGVVLVFRDITERKRAEEARSRLAAIVESSDDAIIGKDLDGIIMSWNSGAARLYGYSAEEVIGKPIALLIPPEQEDELPAILDRLRRGERVDHYETVRVRKDGQRLDVSVTISPIRDDIGQIIGASAVARDITARKRAQEALQFLADASATLAALVDHESTLQKLAAQTVPVFADWCVVELVSEVGEIQRAGVAHADPARGRWLRQLRERYPSDGNSTSAFTQVIRSGQARLVTEVSDEFVREMARDEVDLAILRELDPRSLIVVPLVSRGRVLGAIGLVMAESGRRYNQADLVLAEDLARRAATAIENARLYREAREDDRRKDEFLAMLAHELRNPLAPISNALQLMALRGSDAAAVARSREIIQRQFGQLVRLVDDLLDVSRITRGKIKLQKETIDLATLVSRAVDTTRSLIESRRHQITVSLPAKPLHLEADPARLEQVLTNLLNNAAKYMEEGGQIWLTAAQEGSDAVLRVRDTGIGIAPEVLPRIFDLFTQAERSLDRSEGGLGIGLTLVRQLVQMHGGRVEAHSAGPGRGSEFVVRLPAPAGAPGVHGITATLPAPHPPASRAGTRGATAPDGQRRLAGGDTPGGPARAGCRLLIVDDNVDSADTLAMVAEMWGHEVRIAHDGVSAVEVAKSFRPEIVLLDIGLPGMDGYAVASELRRSLDSPQTLLIAMTGYGQEEDRRRSQESGFDGHLVKPVDLAALRGLLASRRQ